MSLTEKEVVSGQGQFNAAAVKPNLDTPEARAAFARAKMRIADNKINPPDLSHMAKDSLGNNTQVLQRTAEDNNWSVATPPDDQTELHFLGDLVDGRHTREIMVYLGAGGDLEDSKSVRYFFDIEDLGSFFNLSSESNPELSCWSDDTTKSTMAYEWIMPLAMMNWDVRNKQVEGTQINSTSATQEGSVEVDTYKLSFVKNTFEVVVQFDPDHNFQFAYLHYQLEHFINVVKELQSQKWSVI